MPRHKGSNHGGWAPSSATAVFTTAGTVGRGNPGQHDGCNVAPIYWSVNSYIGYLVPAGAVPADGHPHVLTITLGPQHHADYPLRLTGWTLQFNRAGRRGPAQTLTVSHAVAMPNARSPAGRQFKLSPRGGPLVFTASKGTGGTEPTALGARITPAGAVTATFKPGVLGYLFNGVASSTAQVAVAESFNGGGNSIPAVVSRSMLTGSGLHIGSRLELTVGGTDVPIIPVATVKYLPTVGAAPAVLVDQRALSDALQAIGAPPPAITEWWLRTSGQPILTGLPPGTTKLYRAKLAQSLFADPLTLLPSRRCSRSPSPPSCWRWWACW
jgi:hypothetical protein